MYSMAKNLKKEIEAVKISRNSWKDLAKRRKAKNEHLRDEIERLRAKVEDQSKEILRLRGVLARIACPSQTVDRRWWQNDARIALSQTSEAKGGEK